MAVSVDFQDGRLRIDLPAESLVGAWEGPRGMEPAAAKSAFIRALEQPLDYPALRQIVVPGDRVAIALDHSIGDVSWLTGSILEILAASGVEARDTTIVCTGSTKQTELSGAAIEVHDPEDRSERAYLATTKPGRRIYLNRKLTDADVVIPVGRLGYDPILGYRGPWSTLFPGLSDRETQHDFHLRLAADPPGQARPRECLDEVFEVGWLLGSQFQIGLVPGINGVAHVVAGLADAVRGRGPQVLGNLWEFRPATRAECVVIGVGSSGRESSLDDLVEALVTASRIVRQGGRIVALSRCRGPAGPSLHRLTQAGDVRDASRALQGHDDDPDSVSGRRFASVLSWADVYLLSELDRQLVEDLSMIPLEQADDACRLAARAGSCSIVNRAEWTRATARDEEP